MDRACADAWENLFSLGVGSLLAAGVSLLLKGVFTAATVGAAVASVGGWIAFFILVSAAYWALSIHLFLSPKTVESHDRNEQEGDVALGAAATVL
jgi:hypothetical protein